MIGCIYRHKVKFFQQLKKKATARIWMWNAWYIRMIKNIIS